MPFDPLDYIEDESKILYPYDPSETIKDFNQEVNTATEEDSPPPVNEGNMEW